MRDLVPEAKEDAPEVHRQQPVELLGRAFVHGAQRAFDAGVVDRHVDAAVAGLGLVDHLPDVVFAGDVGLQEEALGAQALDLGLEALAVGLAQARGDDFRAGACEGQGGRPADPSRRADDDHCAVGEVQDGHAVFPPIVLIYSAAVAAVVTSPSSSSVAERPHLSRGGHGRSRQGASGVKLEILRPSGRRPFPPPWL